MAFEMDRCCCCSLKAGTITIGILESVISFMNLVLCAAYAESPEELVHMADPSVVPNVDTLRIILILIAVASGLHCVFSILLIFGAETNRPQLLKPWLVMKPAGIVVYILLTLTAILHHAGDQKQAFIVTHIFSSIVGSMISFYIFLVVYNFFKSLKRLNF